MKINCSLVPAFILLNLLLHTCQSRMTIGASKKLCQNKRIRKDTLDLFNKTITFKTFFPRDNNTSIKLLNERVEHDFKETCNMKEQLLSFYTEDVLVNSKVRGKAIKSNIIQGLKIIQDMLLLCSKGECESRSEMESMTALKKAYNRVPKDHKLWKAISEMHLPLRWILETIQ